jgi:ribose 1,5-bisphosphokinase PhnN
MNQGKRERRQSMASMEEMCTFHLVKRLILRSVQCGAETHFLLEFKRYIL